MELRHIYNIAETLNNSFKDDSMIGADISDVEVNITVSPSALYAIDREFFRKTHNSVDGFVHNKVIDAVIDNVHFRLTEK